MKRKIAMVLKLLATGTFSLFLAACYGVMVQWKKVSALYNGSGIQGLAVTLFERGSEAESTTTDATGSAIFAFSQSARSLDARVKIEDVDGAANGGYFADAAVTLDSRTEYFVELKKRQ